MAVVRTIRVSSWALGERKYVTVKVYDSLDEMRAAGEAYNGNDLSQAAGVVQATVGEDGRAATVLVRLSRTHLFTSIVSHEMHHATTALYGAHVAKRITTDRHLNHYNEPFAHLYSDMLHRLVDRLYALGYYDEAKA